MAKNKELPTLADPIEAGSAHLLCGKCKLDQQCRNPYVEAYVPSQWTGRVLCIGEVPGSDGKPFAEKARRALYELAGAAGITERDLALTVINRCRPTTIAKPAMGLVKLCRPFMSHDVLRLRPKWVIAFGENAAKGVFNDGQISIKKLRQRAFEGEQFWGPDAKGIMVTFSFDPSMAFIKFKKGKDTFDMKSAITGDLKWMVKFAGYDAGPTVGPIAETGPVAVDLEWDEMFQITTVAQATGEVAEVTEEPEIWKKWYSTLVADTHPRILVGHSTFQDLSVARLNGLPLASTWKSGERVRDTLLSSRLVDENLPGYDLESLVATYLNVEPWKLKSDSLLKQKKVKVRSFGGLPPDIRMERCLKDTWSTGKLYANRGPLVDPKLSYFGHRLSAVFRRLEMTGLKIDQERYHKLGEIIRTNMAERETILRAVAATHGLRGEDFSPTNNDQFRELLYTRMGVEPIKYTTKAHEPAVDEPTLTLLYQEGTEQVREAVLARLQYQKAQKLYSTYIGEKNDEEEKGLAKHLTAGYYVFPRFNAFGARTGRRSSSKPNIQNWPKRVRSMVVSRFPSGVIVKGDEEKLEPRITAYVAGIDEWLEIFRSGKNFYIETAKRFWGKDVKKDDNDYRTTKATILGITYGMEEELFQQNMAVEQGIFLSLDECSYILNRIKELYPELPRYFELQKQRILQTGQVTALTGQVRHLPCPQGEKTPGFKHLWNQALNFPIQCLASYVTGAALIELERLILERKGVSLDDHYDNLVAWWGAEKIGLTDSSKYGILELSSRIMYPVIMAEVHDELVVDTPEEDVPWVKEAMEAAMTQAPLMRELWPDTKGLMLAVEMGEGRSWAGK